VLFLNQCLLLLFCRLFRYRLSPEAFGYSLVYIKFIIEVTAPTVKVQLSKRDNVNACYISLLMLPDAYTNITLQGQVMTSVSLYFPYVSKNLLLLEKINLYFMLRPKKQNIKKQEGLFYFYFLFINL
jgi:hypothetical protein